MNRSIASTRIYGAVVTFPPVKKGRKSVFFDGMLADETFDWLGFRVRSIES